MATLTYKLVTSNAQYKAYCSRLEELRGPGRRDRKTREERALLTLLTETWKIRQASRRGQDPVRLITSLMAERGIKAKDIAAGLHLSKGYVSDILHYKKGLSKTVIRKLAEFFQVSQELLNRPYPLRAAPSPARTRTGSKLRSGRRPRRLV
ncbi:MAG TPA: helix-turn-helix domain-containing protein [Chitinophagaceae bacterium]|nr:helix-turn-helix domain-containing protein [Chitinophagaceae bacterium]